MIYNTRFEAKLKKPLLAGLELFLAKQEDEAIRYAIVGKRKDKYVIEATMLRRK